MARELKCPCRGFEDEVGTLYRIRPRIDPAGYKVPSMIETNLKHIASITRDKDSEDIKECPWMAFSEPVWIEVLKLLQHEEAKISIDLDTLPNFVYEAFLFYKNCAGQVDAYVMNQYRDQQDKARRDRELKANQAKNRMT